MSLLSVNDIGIDLGTANVRIFIENKGIVVNEPSVIAVNRNTGEVLAVGKEARNMLGRTPGNIVIVRPLKEGVISNYYDTERMLRYFLNKVTGRRNIIKPSILVCVPSGVTEVEKRALIEVTLEVGARQASLIEEPIAAAIGAGIDIGSPCGYMVIDIGGGTTDIAVISLGGMVVSESVKTAGDRLDQAIIRYMRKKHHILIGERTAADIKGNIGSAYYRKDQLLMEVTGRGLNTGFPKTVVLSSNETMEIFEEPLATMLETIHRVLERTPPELIGDISETGICMTGGGSLLYGLDRLISESTGIPCYVAEDAMSCVVRGTGIALGEMGQYSTDLVGGNNMYNYNNRAAMNDKGL